MTIRITLVLTASPLLLTLPACAQETEPSTEGIEYGAVIIQTGINVLGIDEANNITWNGAQITLEELTSILERTAQMDQEPELRFEPEVGASYQFAAEVLQVIKESGVTNFGFVGNERYRAVDPDERETGY